jgi:hypothetical protein
LEWLKAVDTSKLKGILLVHGEKKSQAFFRNYLKENGFPNVQIAQYGKTYELN